MALKPDEHKLTPVAATYAKTNFGELLHQVSVNEKRFVVNRSGKPVAVVLSHNAYRGLTEKKG